MCVSFLGCRRQVKLFRKAAIALIVARSSGKAKESSSDDGPVSARRKSGDNASPRPRIEAFFDTVEKKEPTRPRVLAKETSRFKSNSWGDHQQDDNIESSLSSTGSSKTGSGGMGFFPSPSKLGARKSAQSLDQKGRDFEGSEVELDFAGDDDDSQDEDLRAVGGWGQRGPQQQQKQRGAASGGGGGNRSNNNKTQTWVEAEAKITGSRGAVLANKLKSMGYETAQDFEDFEEDEHVLKVMGTTPTTTQRGGD